MSGRLTFDPATHLYFWDRRRVASVTQALALAGCATLPPIPAWRLAAARDRGHRAHTSIASCLTGETRLEALSPYVTAAVAAADALRMQTIAVEGLISDGKAAGTYDWIGRLVYFGRPWIGLIDWKTGAEEDSHVLQTKGYELLARADQTGDKGAAAIREAGPCDVLRGTVYVTADGGHYFEPHNLDKQTGAYLPLADTLHRSTMLAAFAIAKWRLSLDARAATPTLAGGSTYDVDSIAVIH